MTHWLLALSLLASGLLGPAADAQSNSRLPEMLRIPGTLQSRLQFDHLASADGLSQDSVFSILQDRHGFMWFGTQGGLNRYDGFRVTQYRHDPQNPNSLAGDFIHSLLEDSRGKIWIVGSGNGIGLTQFDPQTETFTRFGFPLPDSVAGRRLVLQQMCEDRSGFLWLGMSGGRSLYRLNPETREFLGFDIGGSLPQGLDDAIVGMYRDRAGILWLGAAHGLIRFDPATGASARYMRDSGDRVPMSIRAMTQDLAGNFWLATTEGGRNFFDPVAGTFSRRWGAPNPERLGVETTTIYDGPDGLIWLGTIAGLEIFDPATSMRAILRHNTADPYSLSGNEILSLATDRDGTMWIGTKGGGVNRLASRKLRFGGWRSSPTDPHGLSDANIRAIYGDRAGMVWIGTYDGGLNRFDPASGEFTHYRHDVRKPQSLDADRVYSIYEDRGGDLWVGTSFGINRLDRRTGTFTHFKRELFDSESYGVPTYSMIEDRRGMFWFGAGERKAALNRQTGTITSPSRTGGLSMHEDRDGNLWSASAGSFTRTDSTGNVRSIAFPKVPGTNEPMAIQINFIHEDPRGLLWLATETGLQRFDPKSEQFTSYTTHEGLPDNVVQCILPDQSGNLWLSTNNGISRFNMRDRSFTNYHEADGLQSEQFNRKACFVDASGVMYFGGLHGFNRFDPREIPPPLEPSRVVLTDFQLNGKAVPIRAGSVLPKPVWEMDTLHLSPADEEFALEFAALSYEDQSKTRYRYMLEGRESRWTEVDSRNRLARYTGLGPGNYRFRVQSSTDGVTWGMREASIAISMAPPWWKTPWSWTGASLIVAGLLFAAYKLRVRTLHARGVRLQKLVDERTAELVDARNQAEQANRAKSAFLANMSHELRTPLNAILGFSGILSEQNVSKEQVRDLGIITRSGEHLLTMINDVLDIAKMEAGRTVLEIAPCDVKLLVEDVSDLIRVRAAEKQVELRVVEGAGVPRYVRTDAARLREVLINLLGNAVKYTDHGSITLGFGATGTTPGGPIILNFEVEDTGIGIAPEDQERIFEPFEQVAAKQYRKGTGLGLAITRQLLVLMGGRIDVASSPGRGSCFRVELPVERAEEPEAKPAAARGQILGLEEGQPEYRILVVDDEPENSMVLERLLGNAGFCVRVADNGEQAVESFRVWRPNFIWMDLRMPMMDGMEAARRIRNLEGGRDVKIAAVTASGNRKGIEVTSAGFDSYLRKPYRPSQIFECMERHLGLRYRRAEAASPGRAERRTELTPDAIAALPAGVQDELRDALVALDVKRISRAVQKVTEFDAALGSVLTEHAERFAYTAMLLAVENGKGAFETRIPASPDRESNGPPAPPPE